VREFLARNDIGHAFNDVRARPVPADEAVALVRRHRKALAKRGSTVVELDPARATDEEIKKHFLGREGTLRAPTLSVGDTIFAGFDEASFRALFPR
jgi:arsenate reductase-like glutaredoxin family protein